MDQKGNAKWKPRPYWALCAGRKQQPFLSLCKIINTMSAAVRWGRSQLQHTKLRTGVGHLLLAKEGWKVGICLYNALQTRSTDRCHRSTAYSTVQAEAAQRTKTQPWAFVFTLFCDLHPKRDCMCVFIHSLCVCACVSKTKVLVNKMCIYYM